MAHADPEAAWPEGRGIAPGGRPWRNIQPVVVDAVRFLDAAQRRQDAALQDALAATVAVTREVAALRPGVAVRSLERELGDLRDKVSALEARASRAAPRTACSVECADRTAALERRVEHLERALDRTAGAVRAHIDAPGHAAPGHAPPTLTAPCAIEAHAAACGGSAHGRWRYAAPRRRSGTEPRGPSAVRWQNRGVTRGAGLSWSGRRPDGVVPTAGGVFRVTGAVFAVDGTAPPRPLAKAAAPEMAVALQLSGHPVFLAGRYKSYELHAAPARHSCGLQGPEDADVGGPGLIGVARYCEACAFVGGVVHSVSFADVLFLPRGAECRLLVSGLGSLHLAHAVLDLEQLG